MRNEMKVSIITVTYNVIETIEQTINSVLNQSYENIEYIIVDGMSTDGTWEKICQYKNRINSLVHEQDRGLYDALNKGILLATGEIVGIINGDDWYEKEAVERVVKEFQYDTDIVYGNLRMIGYEYLNERANDNVYIKNVKNIWYDMIPHPTVFIKRHIYQDFGMFDLKYLIASDYELLLRYYSKGVKFRYTDNILANFRKGGLTTRKRVECAKETKSISLLYIDQCPEKKQYITKIFNKYQNSLLWAAYEQRDEIFKENLDKTFMHKDNLLCIFGSGIWGRRCAEKLNRCGIQRYCYVDNDISKQGKQIDGHEIVSPDRLQGMECNIIIAVSERYDDISRQLARIGNHRMQWIGMFDLYKE